MRRSGISICRTESTEIRTLLSAARSDKMSDMSRFSSMVWVLPYTAVSIVGYISGSLRRATDIELTAFVACVAGMVAGIAWAKLYPRPLAQRLTFLAGIWVLITALLGVAALVRAFGGSIGTVTLDATNTFGVIAAISVLAGLVLVEIRAQPEAESSNDVVPGPESVTARQ